MPGFQDRKGCDSWRTVSGCLSCEGHGCQERIRFATTLQYKLCKLLDAKVPQPHRDGHASLRCASSHRETGKRFQLSAKQAPPTYQSYSASREFMVHGTLTIACAAHGRLFKQATAKRSSADMSLTGAGHRKVVKAIWSNVKRATCLHKGMSQSNKSEGHGQSGRAEQSPRLLARPTMPLQLLKHLATHLVATYGTTWTSCLLWLAIHT